MALKTESLATAEPVIEPFCDYALFSRLAAAVIRQSGGFFLDGGGGVFKNSRYSFLGCDPFLVLQAEGTSVRIGREGRWHDASGDVFTLLDDLVGSYRITPRDVLPPFIGGAVGYLSYDLGRLLEQVPALTCRDLDVPECRMGFYNTVLAVDHRERTIIVVASGFPEKVPRLQRRKARQDIAELRLRLESRDADFGVTPPGITDTGQLRSNFTREDYCRSVERVRQYIAAGDVYQVNLSQRFTCPAPADMAALYETLRAVSPAPFSGFLDCGGFHILSASPERFLRMSGSTVETRPIKGTRPRGDTSARDRQLRRELLASAKDRAELLMIVDLERNDLGRVCQPGSIRPVRLCSLEAFADVYHLVATITGTLAPGTSQVDCLKACFPGGSITGAPKIRAMEIIEELEPCRRSVYTGSMGYIGFNGETDLNIAIRTMTCCSGSCYFHVGGGIVADSEPELEFQETLHKAAGIMKSLTGGARA